MHGVCIDVANPNGRISPARFRSLGVQFVRAELRASQPYQDIPTALLYGPSTEYEFYFRPANLSQKNVLFVIIGNEPDGTGESSWHMTPREYIGLYNRVASSIPDSVPICTAGMVGGPEFLARCWPGFVRKPNFVNKHCPNYENQIKVFQLAFNRPVVVGEHCWYTCQSQQEMNGWIDTLSNTTAFASWFCLTDEMVDKFGVYRNGTLTRAGRYFRNALHLRPS